MRFFLARLHQDRKREIKTRYPRLRYVMYRVDRPCRSLLSPGKKCCELRVGKFLHVAAATVLSFVPHRLPWACLVRNRFEAFPPFHAEIGRQPLKNFTSQRDRKKFSFQTTRLPLPRQRKVSCHGAHRRGSWVRGKRRSQTTITIGRGHPKASKAGKLDRRGSRSTIVLLWLCWSL